ncbi:hypothetical protein FDP41_011122 [Naegleria fowleri]|uniref:Matrin-type domain-containing protein n=1 Tax=Naegleria fowleri TaxID=5763 RepID=A0A6A5C9E1_NAEFO|nr:uncharacterized protein FDP41_011122 [Naegleria fowleri]KAF0983144.1 hypothetical protein FDP41_011122 [Naegleria fowleri]
MPKFYCDYCDVFLTNDSISVRKLHYKGWKHKTNVRAFYAQFVDDPTSALMVSTQTNNANNQVANNPNMMVMNPLLSGGVAHHQSQSTVATSKAIQQQTPQQPVLEQPIMMMGVPLIAANIPGMIMIPGSNTALVATQQQSTTIGVPTSSLATTTTASDSISTTNALNTTIRQSMEQMIKTPELAIPPFVPDQDESMDDATQHAEMSSTPSSMHPHHHHRHNHEYPPFIASELCHQHHEMPGNTMNEVSTITNVPPPLFLFPPPPPPHLVNLCPEIPLTGSYQQYAPSPPFPFILQKQQQQQQFMKM